MHIYTIINANREKSYKFKEVRKYVTKDLTHLGRVSKSSPKKCDLRTK